MRIQYQRAVVMLPTTLRITQHMASGVVVMVVMAVHKPGGKGVGVRAVREPPLHWVSSTEFPKML